MSSTPSVASPRQTRRAKQGARGEWSTAKVSPTDVAVAVRNLEKTAEFAARRVSVRRADYNEPASVEQAFAGVDTVLLISSTVVGRRVAQYGAATFR